MSSVVLANTEFSSTVTVNNQSSLDFNQANKFLLELYGQPTSIEENLLNSFSKKDHAALIQNTINNAIRNEKKTFHHNYNCDKVAAMQTILRVYFEAEFYPIESDAKKMTTKQIVRNICKDVEEDNFHIVDLSHVIRQVERWRLCFPRINPYYAVKCNPNESIIKVMYMMGCGFDCASLNEIKLVTQLCNEVDEWFAKHPHFYEVLAFVNNVTVEQVMSKKFCTTTDIIFANPCKQLSHVRYARDNGLQWTTIDSPQEVEKLARQWKDVKGVIRIKTDDSNSACAFSSKFGVSIENARGIFQSAKDNNVELCGVSFHVGSGCQDVNAYVKAVKDARIIFDMAEEYGYSFNLLDIGGGFLGNIKETPTVEDVASNVRDLIDDLFPSHVKVISEPGRFIAQAVSVLVVNIFSKKDLREENKLYYKQLEESGASDIVHDRDDFIYYLNDGIYGSFNNIYFDHAEPTFKTIKTAEEKGAKYKSTCFGPTCDSIDITCKGYLLPELNEGDFLYFTNFGAYTTASSSQFNGFQSTQFKYIFRN
ncbi:ornithine decarboxylase [Naegleria gruberi]|uniref:ornithine decarboxylase n=1 Tax=Naegleria gruberi TaxID=5762 RepID=D2VNR6_NAEGR|nr:ornithine decarboxylase [Naegleria gruberi]EFC41545.1 ornithine decarboxylase [Naegleria gruberi]|eukprot:XP_002674289.1 ornithine decarboxylase [Naegleria gruberi strain NEG-M]